MPAAFLAVAALAAVLALAVLAWVFVPAFQGPEAARRHLGTTRLAIASIAVVLLVNVLLVLLLPPSLRPDAASLTAPTFLAAALATQVPMLLLLYARLVAPGALSWADLGLRPVPARRVLAWGLGTGLGGIVLTTGVGLLLAQLGLRSNQIDQYRFILAEGSGAFTIVLLAAVLLAPFVEELFFRGFLFGTLRRRQPAWVAYLVTGTLFAALHVEPTRMNPGQAAALFVGIFALGSLLAWTYERTGSLLPGMLAHSLNNAIELTLFYVAGAAAAAAAGAGGGG